MPVCAVTDPSPPEHQCGRRGTIHPLSAHIGQTPTTPYTPDARALDERGDSPLPRRPPKRRVAARATRGRCLGAPSGSSMAASRSVRPRAQAGARGGASPGAGHPCGSLPKDAAPLWDSGVRCGTAARNTVRKDLSNEDEGAGGLGEAKHRWIRWGLVNAPAEFLDKGESGAARDAPTVSGKV